jgi:Bardet-Biedl syndrome 2 protein
MCFCDVDDDGVPELIVGSDDFMIRAFKAENMVLEITESAKVCQLVHIGDGLFAFALDNGTLGVYNQKKRLWRIKAKFKVSSIVVHEPSKEEFCLVIGWSNGRVEIRNMMTGEVLFKLTLNSPVAKIIKGDYRMDGTL